MKNVILIFIFTPIIIFAQKVGVNSENPKMTLDVNGKVLIGNDTISPIEGTIRFNPATKEFEGFNGEQWVSFTTTRIADTWGSHTIYESDSLVPTDLVMGDDFGKAMFYHQGAQSLFVGCPSCDVNGNIDQGAVYVYRYYNYDLYESKIVDPNGQPNDKFGTAIDGFQFEYLGSKTNYVMIGAPGGDKAIIFSSINNFQYSATINAPMNQSTERFGEQLSFTSFGKCAIWGQNEGAEAGNVYLFKKIGANYIPTSYVTCSSVQCNNDYYSYGHSLLLLEHKLIVASPHTSPNSKGQLGELYIYSIDDNNSIISLDTIYYHNGQNGAHLGLSLQSNDNRLIVGVPFLSNGFSGHVNIYDLKSENWNILNEVSPKSTDGGGYMNFGYSISLNGDYLLIGAPGEYLNGEHSVGSAYLTKRNAEDFLQIAKIRYADPFQGGQFGRYIAMGEDHVFVGIPNHTNGNGKVYVYKRY